MSATELSPTKISCESDKYFITNVKCSIGIRRVLQRSGVILSFCSKNSQAEWVRYPEGPHYLSVMTRGRALD